MIADDLTGACDAGVQFAERGLESLVWLAPDPPPRHVSLLILVSGGRSLAPAEARKAAASACRRLLAERREIIFEKIDSTFRGNPGAEILAVIETAGFPYAVLTPAFPAMGRTVSGGRLRVEGEEPFEINLATRLAEQGVNRLVELAAGDYERLPRLDLPTGAVVVADASSEEELARLAQLVWSLTPRPLPVGSAGLAAAIAQCVAAPSEAARLRAETPAGRPGGVLLVIGSRQAATRRQVEALAASGAEIATLSAVGWLRDALRAGRHGALMIETRATEPQQLEPVAELVRLAGARGVVVSGGDTAALLIGAVGAQGIALKGEIETGLAWGRLVGGALDGVPVATKAGGFGGAGALLAAARFLSGLVPLE